MLWMVSHVLDAPFSGLSVPGWPGGRARARDVLLLVAAGDGAGAVRSGLVSEGTGAAMKRGRPGGRGWFPAVTDTPRTSVAGGCVPMRTTTMRGRSRRARGGSGRRTPDVFLPGDAGQRLTGVRRAAVRSGPWSSVQHGARAASTVVLVWAGVAWSGLAAPPRPDEPTMAVPSLVWHAEMLDGTIVSSVRADEPINPASVVKVATTWWAIEALGPDHRFATEFLADGAVDRVGGVLRGNLVVRGGADPDFHHENAFRVAEALVPAGISRVTGDLLVDGKFWTGWERGAEGTESDPERRALAMATALRRDLDPELWDRATRATWIDYAARRGVPTASPPRVEIAGRARFVRAATGRPVAIHRSKPLADALRRFNCYSNNDIERVARELGSADDLARFVAGRIAGGGPAIEIATASGLGRNRMTPRQIVSMLREFRAAVTRRGRRVEELLPVAGCDPGTLRRGFPRLASGLNATALVGKTGTLVVTDGGVSALAGFLSTASGEIAFVVAAPSNGSRIGQAQAAEEEWVLELLTRAGGPRSRACAPPLAPPDEQGSVSCMR